MLIYYHVCLEELVEIGYGYGEKLDMERNWKPLFKLTSKFLLQPEFLFFEDSIKQHIEELKLLPASARLMTFGILEQTLKNEYTDTTAKATAYGILLGLLFGLKLQLSTIFTDDDIHRLGEVSEDLFKDLIVIALSARGRVKLEKTVEDWIIKASDYVK